MKAIALIPARWHSPDMHERLMQKINNKTLIRTTYEAVVNTGLFADVIVLTDHDKVINEIRLHGGKAVKSKKDHESDIERTAEAAAEVNADIIVQVPGHHPLIEKLDMENLLAMLQNEEEDYKTSVTALVRRVRDESWVTDTNVIKVAQNLAGFALLYSRSMIPHYTDRDAFREYYTHVNVFGYRRQALLDFVSKEPSFLEQAEHIEVLRFLDHNIRIRASMVSGDYIEVNSYDDLYAVEDVLRRREWQ